MERGIEADPRYLELLEANRRLRELGHRKDDAMAVCAHDLRSPLNVILGHVRLLLRGSRGPLGAPQKQSVESIERQVLRMVELVEDLLDLRALERGRLTLERHPGDLKALVEESCGNLAVLAQSHGLSLLCEVAEETIEVSMDPGKIREVLENLVGNALRLTPSPGTIAVRLFAEGSAARLEVRDSGPGIAPEILPKIFEAGSGWRRERRAGNGLGLAICREIVELHGGRIEAQNLPGGGAAFVVRLPIGEPDRKLASAPTQKPRVLLAEDDADARAIVADLLGAHYELAEAGDGEDALRLARATAPDIILMDLFMPRLDGFAALEDLRRDPRTADVPVILLSAQNDDLTKVRGLDLGAADFLVKPFSGRELLARVAKALQQKSQREHFLAMAQTDGLTGLPNYRAFRARLDEELRRASRYHTELSLVMIDLDELKALNDRHGHAVGNQAIVALANVIRQELRGTDFAARYGGDEFVALLPHTDGENGARFAERVRAAFSITGDQLRLPLHISVGVAEFDHAEPRADALIEAADAALYRAKRGGRDRVAVASRAEAPAGPMGHASGEPG